MITAIYEDKQVKITQSEPNKPDQRMFISREESQTLAVALSDILFDKDGELVAAVEPDMEPGVEDLTRTQVGEPVVDPTVAAIQEEAKRVENLSS